MVTEADLQRCPTCEQQLLNCATVWPPSAQDVTQVHCRLPRGHRSEEHWHPPLWPGTPALLWFDEPPAEDMIQ
jgi:hypothetical protein